MITIPVCHWDNPAPPPSVNIESVTLPAFGGSSVGVGASTYGSDSGLYLIAPIDGSAWALSSPDGITWTQRPLPGSSTIWNNAAHNGTQFIVGSSTQQTAYVSASGSVTSWSSKLFVSGFTPAAKNLTGGSGGFKYTFSNRAYVSTNGGTTWTVGLPSGFASGADAYQNGTLRVVFGTGSYKLKGLYWPNQSISGYQVFSVSPQMGAIAGNSSLICGFVLGASNIVTVSTVFAGIFGSSFLNKTLPVTSYYSVAGATSNWIFAFTPNSDQFIYTTNGTSWIIGTLPSAENWATCASNGNELMLFSASSDVAYKLSVS